VYGLIKKRTIKTTFILLLTSWCVLWHLLWLAIMEKVTHYTLHFVVSCKIRLTFCCLFVTMSAINIDLCACRLKQKLSDTISMVHQTQYDSSNKHIMTLLARNSYYINHVANCFIYAIFDKAFRQDVRTFFW